MEPMVSPKSSGLPFFVATILASSALAQPLFEDNSERTKELRTHPGIRASSILPNARQAEPRSAQPLPSRTTTTTVSSGPASAIRSHHSQPPTDMRDFERLRAEREAEVVLRPALESAVRGARVLGIPAPEYADGTPLFVEKGSANPVRGQAKAAAEGVRTLLSAAEAVRGLAAQLTSHSAPASAEITTSVRAESTTTSTESGPPAGN
jgi:hypothetical protein